MLVQVRFLRSDLNFRKQLQFVRLSREDHRHE
jgi:hypothetical protein